MALLRKLQCMNPNMNTNMNGEMYMNTNMYVNTKVSANGQFRAPDSEGRGGGGGGGQRPMTNRWTNQPQVMVITVMTDDHDWV